MTELFSPLLSKIDTVLFDLDGTLLDTAPDLVHALNRVCDDEGSLKPKFDLARSYVSTGAVGLIKLAFPSIKQAELEPLRLRLVNYYSENLCRLTKPFNGVIPLINELEEREKKWGIVTNKPSSLTNPILNTLGLNSRCVCVVSGDTLSKRKPHPATILHALKLSRGSAERSVYIGDAPQDITAAKAAGVKSVAACWGYIMPGQNPLKWSADYTIKSPQELLSI
ncbi:MAG: HAD-IA family hydrolase [Pseudomonadota bacterium]|nr:HAD-IA family hydrolase [Pseudomonadota bacterium]